MTVKLYLVFPLSEVKNINSCKLYNTDILNSGLCGQKLCSPSFLSIHSQWFRLIRPFLLLWTFSLMFLIQFSSPLVTPMFIISWEDPSQKAVMTWDMLRISWLINMEGWWGLTPISAALTVETAGTQMRKSFEKSFCQRNLCQRMGNWLFANIYLLQ